MYLFERAYVDYGIHLWRFNRRLRRCCGRIWDWFLHDKSEILIQVILGACVGLAVPALGTLYILSAGRFQWASAWYGVGLVAACVTVLVLGGQQAVRQFAKAVLGAVAAGTVASVALLSITPALAVFGSYLLVLLALTGALLTVFVPMRLAHGVWLLWRRIYRRCPYDDCGQAGLPIHICTCGAGYDDLLPSFYGIFYHTCRHGANLIKLPTMDFLGRKQLPRLCRHCKRPLVLCSFGELPEWPIAVVGGPSSGKTLFLRQATRRLLEVLSGPPGGQIRIDAEAQQRKFEQDCRALDRGQVAAKTGGSVMQAVAVAIRVPNGPRCLLYLYDAPGEDFMVVRRFGRKQNVPHLAGILLLVDPLSFPALAEHARRLGAGVKVSETPLQEVVAVLVAGVSQGQARQAEDKCAVPLAVVLAKTDVLPVDEYSYLAGLGEVKGRPATAGQCREALLRLGAGNSVRALEQKFQAVRYFACSALGRFPDPRDTRPFHAIGVAEPLLWLLGVSGDSADQR
jgi:hypothetical protein